MSTKYPLNCWLAELAAEMEHRQVHLKLKWRRRDLNQEADDLTNEDFNKFHENNRMHIDFKCLQLRVFYQMLPLGRALYTKPKMLRLGGALYSKSVPARGSAKQRRTSTAVLSAW